MEEAYEAALEQLGGLEVAKPKTMLDVLQPEFPELTLQHVKWHLQSSRRRESREREQGPSDAIRWTGRLEAAYEGAVAQLGGIYQARPRDIQEKMQGKFPDITAMSIKYHLFAQRRREQRLQQRGAGNAGGAAADSSQAAAPSAADAPPPAAAASAAATAAAAAAPAQRQPTSSGGFAAHPMDCGQGQQQRQRYCFFAHPEHVPWIPFTVPSADEALAVLRKNTQHCRQVIQELEQQADQLAEIVVALEASSITAEAVLGSPGEDDMASSRAGATLGVAPGGGTLTAAELGSGLAAAQRLLDTPAQMAQQLLQLLPDLYPLGPGGSATISEAAAVQAVGQRSDRAVAALCALLLQQDAAAGLPGGPASGAAAAGPSGGDSGSHDAAACTQPQQLGRGAPGLLQTEVQLTQEQLDLLASLLCQ
ncbi:hypothetical protein CHLNCDRAFT_142186 [Chlorella variabilis]|uniref:Myb-like domain-containing protein n=1 Tax=Chlorella variabilis TaxID=554065 RepID=E1Z7Z4_CHLVA|nr:hypothetical protein CHLNCDRAFT_142186 [Chlorella variabilis]EFN58253.1 hypothetical protein CHLNCDRAFT_142186 [Chlorella variabilis]|eukprot:XP_005850355.1 hypothetical protein CHLNCDRAFT_142186 [Chlorella variabilis]